MGPCPKPEVVLAQHVMPVGQGKLIVRDGHMTSLADSWKITVHGQQAHGSQPDKSIDPIVAAAALVMRLQTIVSLELSPSTPAGSATPLVCPVFFGPSAPLTRSCSTMVPRRPETTRRSSRRTHAPSSSKEQGPRFPEC